MVIEFFDEKKKESMIRYAGFGVTEAIDSFNKVFKTDFYTNNNVTMRVRFLDQEISDE